MPWFSVFLQVFGRIRKIKKSGSKCQNLSPFVHVTSSMCTVCTCSIVFEVECVRTWNRTNVFVDQAKTHAHKNILTSLFADQAHPHDESE